MIAEAMVDSDVINAFRQHEPSDEVLVGTAAWASYIAARRISSWLDVGNFNLTSTL